MNARIFKPARSAMQSGNAKTQAWILEFYPESPSKIDPLMGWTSSKDTQAQVRISFPDKESAINYAKKHGINALVTDPKKRQPVIRNGGYGENFSTSRKTVWTH